MILYRKRALTLQASDVFVRVPAAAVLIGLLLIGLNISTQVGGVTPIRPSACPTYHTNLLVIFVDSTPRTVTVGSTVVTTFHVVYPDLTPVVLSPEVAAFSWSNSSGVEVTKTSPVVSTGQPGFYTYTNTVTPEYPTGLVTIAVVICSCQDGAGNFGPVDSISSALTADQSDNSVISIGPVTPQVVQPPPPQFPFAIIELLIVLALLIVALLLLIRRRRKQANK